MKHWSPKTGKLERCVATGICVYDQYETIPVGFSEPLPVYGNPDEQEFWEQVRSKMLTFCVSGKEVTLAPVNKSSLYCLGCMSHLPSDHPLPTYNKDGRCPECGEGVSDGLTGVSLLPQDISLLQVPDEVFNRRWFHASTVDQLETLRQDPEAPFLHLGSWQAALDRSRNRKGCEWLYEMEIVPDTSVGSTFFIEDPFDDYASRDKKTPDGLEVAGVTRYLNYHEDRGSVSLVVNPMRVRVISVARL